MAVALPYVQEPFVASPSMMDQGRFAALEKRVESMFLQMQQLDSIPAPSLGSNTKEASNPSKSNSLLLTPNLALSITPDISLPATPALQPEDNVEIFENPSTKLALQILDIIQRYGQNISPKDIPWAGKTKFLPFVEDYVKNNEPVRMVLPAFPFKSPNRKDKVLGSMPDLGEELALMHLNGLCESIAEVYVHGANVTITSDGLVYNGEFEHMTLQTRAPCS